MKGAMSEIDLDELRSELSSYAKPAKGGASSAKEQRIIAGFEEIERFVAEHDRLPQHGEDRDIFERLYAVRLDRIRGSAECRAVLKERDPRGLLGSAPIGRGNSGLCEEPAEDRPGAAVAELPSDDELLSALRGDDAEDHDIAELRHVRSREEIRAAEEVAKRNPCEDFDAFRPVFERVQHELSSGQRQTFKYKDYANVRKGDLFILDGQKVIVADMGEEFVSEYGRPDRRLRVVYDNGTESDLLLRSLQRALNKDKVSRRITEPDHGPLFSGEEDEEDIPAGYIYVLRSKSEHPFVAENRLVLHKIGVTGGEVNARVANARKDPTFLLAEVEIVASFKLAQINRRRLEALLHKFFGSARLDFELKDRFGFEVTPREWFLAPYAVIEEAIGKLMDGSIGSYRYEPAAAEIVPIA
jgi:hypothetical protein